MVQAGSIPAQGFTLYTLHTLKSMSNSNIQSAIDSLKSAMAATDAGLEAMKERAQTNVDAALSEDAPQVVILPIDWAYIEVEPITGFATVKDAWDGLAMAYLDSLDEALDYCEG